MKIIQLKFEGFYPLNRVIESIYERYEVSGVYCVYAGRKLPVGRLRLRKLLYIGESDNVSQRFQNHEKILDWQSWLSKGEQLYISVAQVPSSDRKRAEAACIYEMHPPCNNQGKTSFEYPKTRIIISGKTRFLDKKFDVGEEGQ